MVELRQWLWHAWWIGEIDKNGHIRYKRIGEFNQQTAEEFTDVIETLLEESPSEVMPEHHYANPETATRD